MTKNSSSNLYYVAVIMLSILMLGTMLISVVSIYFGGELIIEGVTIKDRLEAIKIITIILGGVWIFSMLLTYVVFKVYE